MPTIHEFAANEAVGKVLENPVEAQCLFEILAKMQSREWGFWQDVIVQKAPWKHYELTDAYCFGQVQYLIVQNELITASINLHKKPPSDRRLESINDLLSTLPRSFRGEARGGPGDNDGYVAWSNSELFAQETELGPAREMIPPMRLPLEVGYTLGSKTMHHIWLEKGVARWPYGCERLMLLVVRSSSDYWRERYKAMSLPYVARRPYPVQLRLL
jgi:hypothetical protein